MAKKTVYDNPKAIYAAVGQCKSDCRITFFSDFSKYCADCKAAYSARNEIIDGMKSMLFGMAIPLSIRHHCNAEDMVHVAIAKILTEFHRFKPELGYSPNTYFGLIAYQVMNDFASRDKTIKPPPNYAKNKTVKKQRDQAHTVVSIDGFMTHGTDGVPNHIGVDASNNLVDHGAAEPHVALERKETAEIVQAALASIPAKYRSVVLDRIDGKTCREISKKLKISRSCALAWENEAYRLMREFVIEKKWKKP